METSLAGDLPRDSIKSHLRCVNKFEYCVWLSILAPKVVVLLGKHQLHGFSAYCILH